MDLLAQYASSSSSEDESQNSNTEPQPKPPKSIASSTGSPRPRLGVRALLNFETDNFGELSNETLKQASEQRQHGGESRSDVEIIGENTHAGESFRQVQIKEEPQSDIESEANFSDSESLDSSEISDHDDDKIKQKKRKPPKAKDELWLQDLPPIEDLHISVPHEECQPIGVVKSVVESLVIVESYPLTPALDIDSVLFLDQGDKALGHIFDVFGQVNQPHYCVRFNSKDHVESRGIKIGDLVYCAPKTPHTSYVLLAQLQRLKGTDSSWKYDHEPPPDQLEYSDDEAERVAVKVRPQGQGEFVVGQKPRKQRAWKPRQQFYNYNQGSYVPPNIAGFQPHFYSRGGSGRRGHHHQYYPPPYADNKLHYPLPPPPPPPPPQLPQTCLSQPFFQYPHMPPPPPPLQFYTRPPPPPQQPAAIQQAFWAHSASTRAPTPHIK